MTRNYDNLNILNTNNYNIASNELEKYTYLEPISFNKSHRYDKYEHPEPKIKNIDNLNIIDIITII